MIFITCLQLSLLISLLFSMCIEAVQVCELNVFADDTSSFELRLYYGTAISPNTQFTSFCRSKGLVCSHESIRNALQVCVWREEEETEATPYLFRNKTTKNLQSLANSMSAIECTVAEAKANLKAWIHSDALSAEELLLWRNPSFLTQHVPKCNEHDFAVGEFIRSVRPFVPCDDTYWISGEWQPRIQWCRDNPGILPMKVRQAF